MAPQVTSRAEDLGSGLLHQGCRPQPDQFIGVFAQNRPEVTTVRLHRPPPQQSSLSSSISWLKVFDVRPLFGFSGSSQSWPATPTPWWWFLCTTHWAQTPYASSSTQVKQRDGHKRHKFVFLTRGGPSASSSSSSSSPSLPTPPFCWCLSADISTVICDKVDKAEVLLENVEKKETPGLQRIILMDAVQPHLVERGQHCGVHVQAMQELEVEWRAVGRR